ncbi:PBP1A family penicillin-binding protein [Eubacteriales bacterium OttesenSCG-928-K08]|nr:PBP1A family penicillin-binding protein [Eubacteriales bacterium OttesenSCG-928-K08]
MERVKEQETNVNDKKRKKNVRQAKRFKALRRVLLAITLIFVCFCLFGSAYILQLDAWKDFDSGLILDVQQSLLVYDNQGVQVSCLSGSETRIWVSLAYVPSHVRQAFISAEDARFYDHVGVDVIRILGAAWEDIKAGAYVQGASTISQQLIKLSHLTDEKVMSRKIEEAVLAYQMEKQFSKDEILEMYLNYVYFGGGFYGIEAAARGYFGVSAKDLTVAQGAMLAGILKGPSRYAPHLNMEASTSRRNLILRLMNEYGYIDEKTMRSAQAEQVELTNSLKKDTRGYYIDCALQQACEALNISMTELLAGGYRINTALDSELQLCCEQLMLDEELFPENSDAVQAALVLVDVESGGVAALMGGRQSTTALEYNRAVRIRRQPGSVIKPILSYAPALEEHGYTTVSMMLDEPTDFNGYQPSNFGESYRGWVTMRQAVMHSLNVPAVKVLSEIGVENAKSFARQLGIEFDEDDTSLTLALGGFTFGVSPYQIAGAYATFARGGIYSTPSLIMSIEDKHGQTVYAYEPENRQVMSEANAYILTDMLKSAIESGTGKRLNTLGIELAGKTGTTGEGDGNRDAWMAAYNPEYAVAVWMGYDESGNGNVLPADATGGKYPALILLRLFGEIYEDAQAAPVFLQPESVSEVRIDGYSLESSHVAVLASALTPASAVTREVFAAGTEPTSVSDYWVVPSPPSLFSGELGMEGYPVLTFTPELEFILYRLYREDAYGNTVQLGEWPGSVGELSYVDRQAVMGEIYSYYIIPAHPQLKIAQTEVVGPASRRVEIVMPTNPFIVADSQQTEPMPGRGHRGGDFSSSKGW